MTRTPPILELEVARAKYNKLLREISVLEKERASTLKRIRILTYQIEDPAQFFLPTEPTKEKK